MSESTHTPMPWYEVQDIAIAARNNAVALGYSLAECDAVFEITQMTASHPIIGPLATAFRQEWNADDRGLSTFGNAPPGWNAFDYACTVIACLENERNAAYSERDALRAALEGTVYVFADHAEATRALTRAELEQLAFARAVLARCKGE